MEINNEDFDVVNELINSNPIIHIRIRKRNNRQSVTSIENLFNVKKDEEFMKLITKKFRKNFHCTATYNKKDKIISLFGDQRENVKKYLIENNLSEDKYIKIHGF